MEECLFAYAQLLCFHSIRHKGAHRIEHTLAFLFYHVDFKVSVLLSTSSFTFSTKFSYSFIYIYRVFSIESATIATYDCCIYLPTFNKNGLAMSMDGLILTQEFCLLCYYPFSTRSVVQM